MNFIILVGNIYFWGRDFGKRRELRELGFMFEFYWESKIEWILMVDGWREFGGGGD